MDFVEHNIIIYNVSAGIHYTKLFKMNHPIFFTWLHRAPDLRPCDCLHWGCVIKRALTNCLASEPRISSHEFFFNKVTRIASRQL